MIQIGYTHGTTSRQPASKLNLRVCATTIFLPISSSQIMAIECAPSSPVVVLCDVPDARETFCAGRAQQYFVVRRATATARRYPGAIRFRYVLACAKVRQARVWHNGHTSYMYLLIHGLPPRGHPAGPCLHRNERSALPAQITSLPHYCSCNNPPATPPNARSRSQYSSLIPPLTQYPRNPAPPSHSHSHPYSHSRARSEIHEEGRWTTAPPHRPPSLRRHHSSQAHRSAHPARSSRSQSSVAQARPPPYRSSAA